MAANNNIEAPPEDPEPTVTLDRNNEKVQRFLQRLKDMAPETAAALTETFIEKKLKIPFDDYFKLLDKVWTHPDISKNAHDITMDKRMEAAAPYNVFFNTLKHCPETEKQLNSIKFTDLLCPSLGKLKCSLHITFMAEIWWVLSRYAERNVHKLPMTIIHGYTEAPWPKDETMKELYPDIDYHYVNVKLKNDSLGCHHTKLSIFMYDDDSLRLVIGSSNIYGPDWDRYNQQLWISPKCPKLAEGSSVMSGESPTGFKSALLDYLFSYDRKNISSLRTWMDRVKNADFREIKVALIYTIPGVHFPRKNGSLVHYMGHFLSRDCTIPAPKEEHDSWPVVAQTASLGLVGRTPDEWLTTNLLKALASHKGSPYLPTFSSVAKVKFNLVYPTIENCRRSYLGYAGGACCVYQKDVKDLQPWLLPFYRQWKADQTGRSLAISHSKCYFRLSPCSRKMPYYFLTNANLSRSAWGKKPNPDSSIFVRSYEIGILFLPKYFEEEYFEVMEVPNRQNKRLFPILFDLPLTPYGPLDDPLCFDELLDDDSEGNDVDVDEALSKFAILNLNNKQQNGDNQETAELTKSSSVEDKKDTQHSVKPSNDFFPSFNRN